MAIPNIASI